MDIRQLRYLREVAQAGSFSRAAQLLRITQPALGLQMRKLEQELGTPLFQRHARGVRPTEAGDMLTRLASDLIAGLDEARQNVQDLAGQPRGSVPIGVTASVGLVAVPELVRACRKLSPHLTIDVVESSSKAILDAVDAGDFLLGISGVHRKTGNLVFEPLYTGDFCFVGPASSPLARNAPISFAQVVANPLILPTKNHRIRQLVDDTARKAKLELTVTVELDSASIKKELMLRDGGHTILPYSTVSREIETGTLFARRIVKPQLSGITYLVHSRAQPLPRRAVAVRLMIKEFVERAIRQRLWTWRAPPRD